jgi:hypothetical protein
MRTELHVILNKELECIATIAEALKRDGYNASNSIIVTVSTDYSSIAGQIIRHELTYEGEIADGFGVDVPYPDQQWDTRFVNEACSMFSLHKHSIGVKNIILVEAGVIRGSNYKTLIKLIRESLELDNEIITTTLYENIDSAFKSNYVAEYYNDTLNDLTFWWEKQNNHWK